MITLTVEGENIGLNLTMEASDFIEIMRQPEVKIAGKKALESLGKFGSLAEKLVELLIASKAMQAINPTINPIGDVKSE